MVAQFLRLRLQLYANLVRRGPWHLFGAIVAAVYGLGIALLAAVALLGLRIVDAETARVLVVGLGAMVMLAGFVVPLFLGVDDALDPRRFALLGVPTEQLAKGLAAAALLGVPALCMGLVAVAQVATWTRDPLALLLAVLAAPVLLGTWVLGARVSTSVGAFLLSSRRWRDATGVVGVLALLALAPGAVGLAGVDWTADGARALGNVVQVLSWTPLGAAWAAPADAAAGSPGAGLVKMLIAVAALGLLWLAWKALAGWMLISPVRQSRAAHYRGLGWFDRLPARPAAAIAARSLTYWMRDARYQISLLIVPIVPALMLIPLSVAGVPADVIALVPAPVVALFLGWAIHNDVAYDHTAVWLHVAAHTRGWHDRIGRAIPVLLLGVPFVTAVAAICAAVRGDASALPALLGASLCILFVGVGLSSVMSAAFPYPAVRPGDSPFSQPQGGNTAAGLIQGVSFVATILLAAPVVLLALVALFVDPVWTWPALAAGVLFGAGCLTAGVLLGGRVFERRGPELLAFIQRN